MLLKWNITVNFKVYRFLGGLIVAELFKVF